MALLGGNIHCNLEKTINGDGTDVNPYTPEQLSAALLAATGLSSSVNVLLEGTKILSAGAVLDFSTPLMVDGNLAFTLTFKKKPDTSKCPSVYSEDGLHSERFLVKVGGGNFKTYFVDTLTHVRGSLNSSLECLVEVVGNNEVFLSNNGLVGNNLSDFKVGSEPCCNPEPEPSEDDSYLTFVNNALSFGTSDVKQIVRHGNFTIVSTGDGSVLKVYNTSNAESPVFVADVTLPVSNINKFILSSNTLFAMTNTEITSYSIFTIEGGSNPSSDFTYTPAIGHTLMDMIHEPSNDSIYITEADLSSFTVPAITKRFDLTGGPDLGNLAWTNSSVKRMKKLALTQNYLVGHLEDSSGVYYLITLRVSDGESANSASIADVFDMDGYQFGGLLFVNQLGAFNVQVWEVNQSNGAFTNTGVLLTDDDFTDSSFIKVHGHRSLFISGVHGLFLFSFAVPSDIYLAEKYVTTNLQFIKPIVDDNNAFVASKTLQSMFSFQYFTDTNGQSGGGGGGCCCCTSGGGFLPVLATNANVSLYENTMVVHSVEPEVLSAPTMEKLLAMVNNMVILGNVAYTFLFPTSTGTKVDKNFLFKIASSAVSVIDTYETSVLNPEGLADVGDFSGVQPLVNVLGNRFTLNLRYGPNGAGNGKNSIPVPSALDANYPAFSLFSDSDAGYAPCGTQTKGDVITVIDGEEVLVVANIVDGDNPRKVYTLLVDAAGSLLIRKEGIPQNSDTEIGSDSVVD